MSDEAFAKWRILTVKIVLCHKGFRDLLSSMLDALAEDISVKLAPLTNSPRSSRRKLRSILEQAKDTVLETYKEPSQFAYAPFQIQSPFVSRIMEDGQGMRNSAELERSGEQVKLTVSPLVIRYACRTREEVIICKGKVWASNTATNKYNGDNLNLAATPPGVSDDTYMLHAGAPADMEVHGADGIGGGDAHGGVELSSENHSKMADVYKQEPTGDHSDPNEGARAGKYEETSANVSLPPSMEEGTDLMIFGKESDHMPIVGYLVDQRETSLKSLF